MRVGQIDVADFAFNTKTRFELWEALITAMQARTMAEVGVWKGDYAQAMLSRCLAVEKYFMIDPWATLPDWNKPMNVGTQAFDEIFAEAMAKTAFAEAKRVVLRGKTADVIDSIPDNSLDFVYIDGDHTLRGITIDLIKVYPKVKLGGFIGCDDFTPTPWQHDPRFEPTLVCPFSLYFAEAMGMPVTALPFNQCLMQKTSESVFSFADPQGKYRDISLNRLPPGLRILVREFRKRLAAKLFGAG